MTRAFGENGNLFPVDNGGEVVCGGSGSVVEIAGVVGVSQWKRCGANVMCNGVVRGPMRHSLPEGQGK